MDVKIKQLQLFLTVAETLHFGKAAQLMYMTQPALSFQIQSLESAIGMQLFSRDRRRVELTEAGRNLVATGTRILSEVRLYKESLQSSQTEQRLSVLCAPAGEQVILPAVIRRLKEISPNYRVDLCTLAPIEYVRALQENRVDVLLMVRAFESPGTSFHLISNQRMFAVVPEGSVFARRGSISVHEFARLPVIVAARQHCDQTQPLLESIFARYGEMPRFIEAPGRQSAQEALVAAGEGVSINTEWRLTAKFPGVRMVPFEEPIDPLPLGAAWRTSYESGVLSSFKQALRDVIYELGKQNLCAMPPAARRKMAPAPASTDPASQFEGVPFMDFTGKAAS
ncbi:MAG: LysR family transcriptional regulator [Acidobacteriota bacterium]|nr:LysR family transcriptional regulator [Acidobacteriota bacterium]